MRFFQERLERYACTNASVLIQGETGSGKEVAAQTLHALSARRDSAFVPVNCGAIPKDLVESELFGTALGAFTGAKKRRGWFELADGGTLFLDEIGDLPLAAQTTLLRALESGIIWPVGSESSKQVDVRLICATHRPLQEMVYAKSFREDLYHRIGTLSVSVPPLRHRPEDMYTIAYTFFGHRSDELTPQVWRRLQGHDWPGNIREFRNVLMRAFIHATPGTVHPEHIVFDEGACLRTADFQSKARPLHEVLYEHVSETLRQCDGNVRATARALRISPTTVYRYLASGPPEHASV